RTLHVGFQSRVLPSAKDETVHLVEDDLGVRKHRGPPEAFGIEAPGAHEIAHTERDHRNLLLHWTASAARLSFCRPSSSEFSSPPVWRIFLRLSSWLYRPV